MPSVPNVAMKGGSFRRETMTALAAPKSAPTPRPTTTAAGQGTPPPTSATSVTPTSDMMPPTERSMPPVRMTRVMPKATTERMAAWDMTFSRLATVAKKGTNWPTSNTAAAISAAATIARRQRGLLASGHARVSLC